MQSETYVEQRYIGVTSDLRKRLADHNAGKSPHTSKYTPWKLITYVAFANGQKAESEGKADDLERDGFSSNRHYAPGFCWSMMFSENRYPPRIKCGASFFGIML